MVTIEKTTLDGDKKVRVVIYIRVSTQEQAQEGYSIEEQKRRLIAYCKARGWQVVEILVDPGFSGANLDRPGIQTLISHIKEYDMVLVYKLDRLSRSQKDTMYLIEEVFLPNDVNFVSLSESFDTSTPFGRAMVGILSVFAQLERENIKERTSMGRLARFREGKRVGPTAPIGYDYDPEEGILVPNEYEAAQVRMVFQLYIGTDTVPGVGYPKICEYMQAHGFKHKYGDWKQKNRIYLTITNPVYMGDSTLRGEVIQNTHEAIISRETFEQAQALRVAREDKFRGSKSSGHLLTGFVYCSCCGARVACATRGGKNKPYYVCYSRNPVNPTMVRDRNCSGRSWKKEELEAIIDYEVRSLIFDEDALGRLIRKKKTEIITPDDQRAAMVRKVDQLDKQIERIMDLYQDGSVPIAILNERVKKLYEEREQLAATLDEKTVVSDGEMSPDEIQAYLSSVAHVWDLATVEQKRDILSVLVNAIYIGGDNSVKIEWSFT